MPTKGKSLSTGRADAGDADLLRLYLDQIGKHDLLDREDEQRLGRVIDAGRRAAKALRTDDPLPEQKRAELRAAVAAGERASKTFVAANLRLVVYIAKRSQS